MICEDFANYAANKALRKLGIKEVPGKVAIVPEATYEFENGGTAFPAESMVFTEGETITITIDGVTYSEKAKLIEAEGWLPTVYIGNLALAGAGDATEVPYLLFAQDTTSVGNGYMFVLVVEDRTSTQHTVAVYKNEGTTITPIYDKYLPGPVVIDLAEYGIDIFSMVTSGGGVFEVDGTADMWAKINENLNGNIRIVAFDGIRYYTLMPSAVTNDIMTFSVFGYMQGAAVKVDAMMSASRMSQDVVSTRVIVVATSTPVS